MIGCRANEGVIGEEFKENNQLVLVALRKLLEGGALLYKLVLGELKIGS